MKPEAPKPEDLALAAAGEANALTVKDQPTFDAAGAKLTALATLKKDVLSKLEPFVKNAHDAHKAAVAERDKYVKPIDAAIGGLKNRMLAWREQEQAKREAEARKAQEAAEKAERERRAAEAKAAEEAAAKAAEEGDLDAAAAAQEEAQAIVAAPIITTTTTVAAPVTKPAGISIPGKYVADLADAAAFVRHVLATPDLAHLIPQMAAVAQSEMNERARRQEKLFNVPGWKPRFVETISARSA